MQASTKYLSFLALVHLAVLTFYATPIKACYCPYRNLHDVYCEAEYVAVIGIWSKIPWLENAFAYDIDVYQTFKMTPEGDQLLQSHRLVTTLKNNSCFVDLTFNKYYLVAGKTPVFDLCDYVKNVDELTNDEKRVFRGDYRHECIWH